MSSTKRKAPSTGNVDRVAALRARWDLLFGAEEALIERGAELARPSVEALAKPNTEPARIGIAWTDPTYHIIYNIRVDGLSIGQPNHATGGVVLRDIRLNTNRSTLLHWTIVHADQGWKNRVFLKRGDEVTLLKEDDDKSTSNTDDVSSGKVRVQP